MKFDGDDTYVLTSGQTVYANHGILGLDPAGRIHEGYDGTVRVDLTPEDRREIADEMIARWNRWAEAPPCR